MIYRFFSPQNLSRVQNDFSFLLKFISKSYGEFDLSIRDDSFNIYYQGNSLSQISFKKNDYQINIHSKFFENTLAHKSNLYNSCKKLKDYYRIDISAKQLHPFLQSKHMLQFASKIKKVNNGEEIGFEQALITDNLNREDVIFIDRQVTDSILKGKRMDLLALKQIKGNRFKFLVSEVKLGKNKELADDVVKQLEGYINHIRLYFKEYKYCYEMQYIQKKSLGLFSKPSFDKIVIEEPVEGIIIVGGYSGIAKAQIHKLKTNYPQVIVKHFTYEL